MRKVVIASSTKYKIGSSGNLPKLHHDQDLYFEIRDEDGELEKGHISYYATNGQKKADVDKMLADSAEDFVREAGKKLTSVWIDHSHRIVTVEII
jgi:hypothetical protein